MIAYEDLVVALSSWRAGQGLPANTVSFLSGTGGSVDLALPVADPVETVGTGEVHALDDEYAVEELAVDEYAVDEAVDEYALEEGAIEDEYSVASDEQPGAFAEVAPDQAALHTLNYEDDESEQTAIASDFESSPFGDSPPAMPPELASPEFDDAGLESAGLGSAEAVDLEDAQLDDSMAADNLDIEEVSLAPTGDEPEPRTEEVDILGEEFADDVDPDQEGPTKFGGLEQEATEMGIGLDKLQAPGPSDDSES